MRIATYNVWNEGDGVGGRFDQLIQEIACADADVIGLQEVTSGFFRDACAHLPQYPHAVFRNYTGEDEGLAFFSRYPISESAFLHTDAAYANSSALNILFQAGEYRFSVTNVHLPWDSIRAREQQIIAVNRYIRERKGAADYFLLLGDLNCGAHSSVHRFLQGEQTIGQQEANPCWLDIAGTFAQLNGLTLPPTLDCINNPRWKGKNTIYTPENFDWIYILDNWKPFSFKDVKVFGTQVSPLNSLCASDHYGVMAEVGFGEDE